MLPPKCNRGLLVAVKNNGRPSREDKDIVCEMPTIQNVQSSFSWTMHLKCTGTEEGPAHTN